MIKNVRYTSETSLEVSATIDELGYSSIRLDVLTGVSEQINKWIADGGVPAPYKPVVADRRLVPKSLIVERLNAAGKLAAAKSALDANLYARERWYAPDKPAVYADDPEVLSLLAAIDADHEVILQE